MVHLTINKCPSCERPYDLQLFGLSSRIGPPQVICPKCKNLFQTRRQEWPLITGRARLRAILMTLVFSLLGALAGGNCLFAGFERWRGNANPSSLPFSDPEFQACAIAAGLFTLSVQIGRMVSSSHRHASYPNQPMPDQQFAWNFNFSSHSKLLLIFLLFFLVGWAKMRLSGNG